MDSDTLLGLLLILGIIIAARSTQVIAKKLGTPEAWSKKESQSTNTR